MIKILVEKKLKKTYFSEIKYSLNFLLRTMGLDYFFIENLKEVKKNDLLIIYAESKILKKDLIELSNNKVIILIKFTLDFYKLSFWNSTNIQTFLKEMDFDNIKIPIFMHPKYLKPYFMEENNKSVIVIFNFDLIGNIFFMLNSSIDRISDLENKYINLFEKYISTPFINIYISLFEDIINKAILKNNNIFLIKKTKWPRNQSKCISFSFSIDSLKKWAVFTDIKILFSRSFFRQFKSFFYHFFGKEDYWNFNEIFYIIEKFNNSIKNFKFNDKFQTTFYLGINTTKKINFSYDYDDNLIDELNIAKKYNTSFSLISTIENNNVNLNNEIKILTKKIKENVNGILYDLPINDREVLYENLNKTELLYSSNQYYNINGFKNGIGYPYRLYNKKKEAASKFLELPINFNDENIEISNKKYLKISTIKKKLVKEIQSNCNCMYNYHFSISNFFEIKYINTLIEYIIKKELTKKVFIARKIDIARWWNTRNSIKISEKEDNIISIFFPGSVDFFSVKLLGNFILMSRKDSIEIRNNCIYFKNVKANSTYEFDIIKNK